MQPAKRSRLVPALRAALLICVGVLSEASAQSAQGSANDFGGLTGVRTVAVVDDSGRETTGRLVRVTPESLTMKFDGHERVFELTHVTTVHEIGDPLTNGLAIDFLVGGALGVVGGALVSCGGYFEGFRTCTSTEKVQNAAIGGVVCGAIGLGIGAVVDKLISRRTLRYARVANPGAATVSLAPSAGLAGARLLVIAAW